MIFRAIDIRALIDTDKSDQELEMRIQALESFICKYTNNDFVNRNTLLKEYPPDVVFGAMNMLKWQIRNEEKNGSDAAKRDVASETLSRHSVTYAQDATETNIDPSTGVPEKLSAFLKPYMRARF